ncbi:ribosome-assembly protein 3-domain-containing protein [Trichophaea hybrida]|nr:ribosome-assembly protein 3-domain-containing protein [Trichophaea hybrida]
MGSTKRAPTSGGSSSSSSDSESEVEKGKDEVQEVEMEDAPPIIERSESEEEEEEGIKQTKAFTEKSGRIPSPLRDLYDPDAEAKFEEYYMRLVTEEFGDDLNELRMAPDFTDKSLQMLVLALKQGVNIYSAEDKQIVLASLEEEERRAAAGGGGGGGR